MATCAVFADIGASAPVLVQSTAEPCTTLVLISPAEYSALATNPLNLTLEQGSLISVGILLCWALAWGWVQLTHVVADDGASSSTND